MEKLVNEVVFRLGTKIPKENVEIVRNVLYLVLKDYEITEKTTEIAVVEMTCQEKRRFTLQQDILMD